VLVQFPAGKLLTQLIELLSLEPVYLNKSVDSNEFVSEVEQNIQTSSPNVLLLVANFHYPTGR